MSNGGLQPLKKSTKSTGTDGADKNQLEVGLEQTQIKRKEVIISSQSSRSAAELPEKVHARSRADSDQNMSYDFESFFVQNGLLDATKNDRSVPRTGPTRTRDVRDRPDRPMTLSRPGQIPSCCNFKRQHWQLYVHGEFSYSSLPRHYKDAEKELNCSYKDELENIIEDLNRKEKRLESDSFFQSKNAHGPDISYRSRTKSDPRRNIIESEAPSSGDNRNGSNYFKLDKCADRRVGGSKCCDDPCGEDRSEQNGDLGPCKNASIFTQNRCLMDDIDRNCADIKNQLGILESVSKMLDHAQTNLSVETEDGKRVTDKLSRHGNSDLGVEQIDETNGLAAPSVAKAPPNVVFETPPPPSQDPPSKSSISTNPCGFSSPSRKLKSRKSRNRSLQRCNEDRLSASERRSRTLSPSITERLDYKVSRATQTCDNSVIFDCKLDMTHKPKAPVPNGKTESHDKGLIQGQRPKTASTQNEVDGNLARNGKADGSHVKQNHEGTKALPFLCHDRKPILKNSLSFSFRGKSHEKKQSVLKTDRVCSPGSDQSTSVQATDASESGPHDHPLESLLDKMHKKLYPYQYNKQNRKRNTEAAHSLNAKKNLAPSEHQPRPATLPQTRPSLPHQRLRHCVSADPGCPSHCATNSDETPTASDKLSATEDSCSGDVVSPSSGYSEMSPTSVKEGGALPGYPRRLCSARPLSPEQSTTSSSTPSPSNCAPSSLKTITEEGSASVGKNSKDIFQLQAAEKKLADACEWLICAGFPQYVQLYREGQFPLALKSVESDHEFLDSNCLLVLLQRITLLNRLMSMKVRLPLTSDTRDWYTGEMLFSLSPIWNYDSNYHWWVRSERTFVANLTKSYGLSDNLIGSSFERSRRKDAEGHTSVPPEVQDEASVHLTSGYESETSPMSTSSLGHQKTIPQVSLCSSSQPVSLAQNSADLKGVCGNLRQNAADWGDEREWGEFLGSSQETVKRASNGSQYSSSNNRVNGDHALKSIPSICRPRTSSVGCYSTSGTETDGVDHLPVSPQEEPDCFLAANSLKFGNSAADELLISFDDRNFSETSARGMDRKSFYDNALSADPQAELDLILAELYRNIGSLDETLNNIDVEVVNVDDEAVDAANGDRLELPSDDTLTEFSEEADKLSGENLKSEIPYLNGTETSEVSGNTNRERKSFEIYESSRHCAFYRSKKAFLSIRDLVRLQKLCILKLTSIFEMHSATFKPEIVCPLRFRSSKVSQSEQESAAAGKRVFGVPPVVLLQRMGVPLPPAVILAMEHLKAVAHDCVGLFRKPGVQSRIQQLQNEIEINQNIQSFAAVDAYDLADVLKRYFRELPESLLSPQASRLLMAIFTDLPAELYLETVQAVMLLLSDVSRQVLHVLLQFLAAVADHSEENQMNSSNLAVCFLPSFFRPHGLSSSSGLAHIGDAKLSLPSNRAAESPDGGSDSTWNHKIAVSCITFLIDNASSAFQIPDLSWTMLHASRSVSETSPSAGSVVDYRSVNIPSFVRNAFDICHFKDSEWVSCASKYDQTELSWRSVDDDRLLPMWCSTTAIEAPPGEVLARLKNEQHLWDNSLIKGRIVERLSDKTDVFHYVLHIDNQEPPREFCELRSWKCDNERGSYILAKTSVFHPNVPLMEILRAITLVSHYLIEPCGAGKSRVMHMSRIDIRGHLLDWYYNVYGRLLERHLYKLNKAFTPVTKNTAGPETNL